LKCIINDSIKEDKQVGYTTKFWGELYFDSPIDVKLKDYINKFSEIRHMKQNNKEIMKQNSEWERHCFNGLLGVEGAYYLGSPSAERLRGERIEEWLLRTYQDKCIIDYNNPPTGVPGLWCDWYINNRGNLEWTGREKFYNYVEWLEYLIKHFFSPEGYFLNGELVFRGERDEDGGFIIVSNNRVKVRCLNDRPERGFVPKTEQWNKIDKWEHKHMEKKHKNKISPNFEYVFGETYLGAMGSVRCNTCCERAMNMSHGKTAEYKRICNELGAEYIIGEV
jgi:hypothetical protein